MACLRMSYMGKAPIRLQRKVCLGSSSSACRQKWWSFANVSGFWRSVTWHTNVMSIENIIIKLIEEITRSDLRIVSNSNRNKVIKIKCSRLLRLESNSQPITDTQRLAFQPAGLYTYLMVIVDISRRGKSMGQRFLLSEYRNFSTSHFYLYSPHSFLETESHTLCCQLSQLFSAAAVSAAGSLDQAKRVGFKNTDEGLVSGCREEGVNCQSGHKEGTVHFHGREGWGESSTYINSISADINTEVVLAKVRDVGLFQLRIRSWLWSCFLTSVSVSF